MRPDFNHIYNQYKHQLFGFIFKIIRDRDETEDIVADCFVKLWSKWGGFDDDKKCKAFLFIQAKNTCVNYILHKRVVRKSGQELVSLIENEDYVLSKIIHSEVVAQIYKEIETLPLECRKIFKMIYIHGMDNREIVSALGITESTVRNQKARGLKLIKIKINNESIASNNQEKMV